MPSDASHPPNAARKSGGSELCLSCGLCCTGSLHGCVVLDPEDVQPARALGLAVEPFGDDKFMFGLPCELYQAGRCSVHPHHPSTCQQYRCALLQKYERGEITLQESLEIVRTAKALLADASDGEAMPRSGEHLRRELGQKWDAEEGLRGTGTARLENIDLALKAVAFDIHLTKHFRLPRKETKAP